MSGREGRIVAPDGRDPEQKGTQFEVFVPEGKKALFIHYDPETKGIGCQPIHVTMFDRSTLYTMLECTRDLVVRAYIQKTFGLTDRSQEAHAAAVRREAARLGLDPSKIQ